MARTRPRMSCSQVFAELNSILGRLGEIEQLIAQINLDRSGLQEFLKGLVGRLDALYPERKSQWEKFRTDKRIQSDQPKLYELWEFRTELAKEFMTAKAADKGLFSEDKKKFEYKLTHGRMHFRNQQIEKQGRNK